MTPRYASLTALLVVLISSLAAAEPVTLKIGSLAPRESPWGQVLRVWVKAVKEKTRGEVEIAIFWNATQGDEPAQMSKMKLGQLDGAIVTAVGLGIVDPSINVLQVPGLYRDWAQLDTVRNALRPRWEKSFQAAGYELIGWGDIGLDRLMSKGVALHLPSDLKGQRPWVWREDPVLPALFQVVGVTPVATSVPEALTELSTGNANVMSVSALAAEQLQWSSRLDNNNNKVKKPMVMAPNIGAMVLSKSKLDGLKPEQRNAVLETARVACTALTNRIRDEDGRALERLRKKFTVIEPTETELAAWKKTLAEARGRLPKTVVPADLMSDVEKLLK